MDPALERIEKMMEIAESGRLNPEEVSHAFELIINALAQIKEQGDSNVVAARREAKTGVESVRREMRSGDKKQNDSYLRLNRLVKTLIEWKDARDREDNSSTVEEHTLALEDQEEAIDRLRLDLRRLSREPGPPGKRGPRPAHEWDDTSIRFQNSDGTWGEWVDLKGEGGRGGGGFFGFGGGLAGVRTIKPGSTNVHVNSSDGDVVISVDSTTGGGSQFIEAPSGAVDDSNLNFSFTIKPFYIVMNGSQYRENRGWTWNTGSGVATMFSPVGTGGDIYGVMQN